jgi:two-component system, cell cycle sensor histidine kinase and response regulator CckA
LPEKPSQIVKENLKGNGETILIVDDNEDQRNIASMLLTHLGYNTRSAMSGEEGVALFKQHIRFDLVILDMIMAPGIDGFETYRQILEIKKGQKAIIASGYSETARVKKALALGAGGYLKKPYTMEKLAQSIKNELSKSERDC